jgi:multiple sugar transport system substrate-binding protein
MYKSALILFLVGLLAACTVEPPPTTQPSESLEPVPTATIEILPTWPSSTVPNSPTSIPLMTPAASPEHLRGVRINFLYPWSDELAAEARSLVDEFNTNNIWGIAANVIGTGGSISQLEQWLVSEEALRDPADVVGGPLYLLDQIRQKQLAGFTVDMTAFIHDPAWGWDLTEAADFGQVFKVQNIPAGTSLPLLGSQRFLLYNRTWGRVLGFPQPPTTPDEFRSQACAAAKANLYDEDPENDGTGGWILDTQAETIYSWLMAFGATPEGSTVDQWKFSSPAALNAFAYLRKLVDNNCAWTSRSDLPYEYFARRQALFYSGSLEDLRAQKKTDDRLKSTDEWMAIPYPAVSGKGISLVSIQSLAIINNSSTEKQLASWLFVRWLLLPRNQSRLAAAGMLLPSRPSSWDRMEDFRKKDPLWTAAATLPALPVPGQGSWQAARMVLEDASWQVLQPFTPPADFSRVLDELDVTITELIQRK